MQTELARLMRRRTGLYVSELSTTEPAAFGEFATLLQDGADVHGSHGLFYWLRARCEGIAVSNGSAGTVLTWRDDVGRLAALRPIGTGEAAVDLLETVAKVTSNVWPRLDLVVRYVLDPLANRLSERGWTAPTRAWTPDAPLDDEAYPEVVVTAEPVELPGGRRFKSVREAIFAHADRYRYRSSPTPLGCGEAEFVTSGAARADRYDEHEAGFNRAVLAALNFRRHGGIRYHYLFGDGTLGGFAVTANTTGVSHGYYLSTVEASRLSTYFLWNIYREERRHGASALNLGGSESRSLHLFKARTFPDHVLQHSRILQHPMSARDGW